jgi:amino acid permease
MFESKNVHATEKGAREYGDDLAQIDTRGEHGVTVGHVANADQLQRHLGNRQIQLIAIGGSIGTATFVSIVNGFVKGGPVSLVLAYTLYSCMLGLCNNGMAEMGSFMPVSGAFIRMAGHWVDEAFGFMGKNSVILNLMATRANLSKSWLELLPLRGYPHPFRDFRTEPRLDFLA